MDIKPDILTLVEIGHFNFGLTKEYNFVDFWVKNINILEVF